MTPEDPALAELKGKMLEAQGEYHVAREKMHLTEEEYATAFAGALGIHIGSVVSVKLTNGIRRYRVARIVFHGYRQVPFMLWGNVIRRDGSDGELREIWQNWQLEHEEGTK